MTRKVCFSLLAILLLITAAGFSSCTEDDGVSNTVSNVVSQDVSEGGRGSVSDGLPDVDFGGRTYTVMCRSEREYEFSADEQNNEYINDTIYERNKTVEERFGVTIETQTTLGEWGQHEEFMNVVRNQIGGNTAEFDIIAGYAAIIPTVVGDDLFYSWYDIEYVDESREWWSEDLVNELTINDNQEYQLTLTIEPPNFTDAIDWKSSNTDIVTVTQDGLIEGRSIGTATIKVTVGNQSASCKVTVVQPVTSISLNKTSLSLDALGTYQLTATPRPSDAYNTKVIWSSSAPEIASVDENGLVTAHKKGTATITATAADGNGAKRNCTVTVSNNAHVAYSTAQLESSHPYEANCKDVWVLTAEGASYIEVTFDAQTYFE